MNSPSKAQLQELVTQLANLDRAQLGVLRQAMAGVEAPHRRMLRHRPGRRTLLGLIAVATLASGITTAWAVSDGDPATSDLLSSGVVIPYRGFLSLDSTPLTGTRTLALELWDDPSSSDAGAHRIWSETQSVNFFNGVFAVNLGTGTQTSGTSLSDAVLDGAKLYLAIQVQDGTAGWVALSGRQAIHAMPYAAWSANAADFAVAHNLDVAGTANITGQSSFGANVNVAGKASADYFDGELFPSYSSWRDPDPAYDNLANGGGAGIVNDNSAQQRLMIVGNRSGGGVRRVGMWDDVHVNGHLTAGALDTFPAGSYCLIAGNSTVACPAGFTVGSVRFDTEDDGNGDSFSGSHGGIYDGSNSSIMVRLCCK